MMQESPGFPAHPCTQSIWRHPLKDLDPKGREQILRLEANQVPHQRPRQETPTGETPLVIIGSWVVCQDTAAF